MRIIATIFLAVVALGGSHAQQTNACDIPGYLLFGDSLLDHVNAAVIKNRALKIVVVGTMSSTLPGPEGAHDAYPARMQAELRRRLPDVAIEVAVHATPRISAAMMAKSFERLLAEEKPTLLIWQTGTFDALRGVDPKEFLASLFEGVGTLQSHDVDVILMNMQYSPRMEAILALSAYDDNMRWVARERHVPLFDRLAIMRHWNDAGVFNLSESTKDLSVAKRLHKCIGRALAALVIDAGRLPAAIDKAAH